MATDAVQMLAFMALRAGRGVIARRVAGVVAPIRTTSRTTVMPITCVRCHCQHRRCPHCRAPPRRPRSRYHRLPRCLPHRLRPRHRSRHLHCNWTPTAPTTSSCTCSPTTIATVWPSAPPSSSAPPARAHIRPRRRAAPDARAPGTHLASSTCSVVTRRPPASCSRTPMAMAHATRAAAGPRRLLRWRTLSRRPSLRPSSRGLPACTPSPCLASSPH